jgi:hypothetical protein
MGRRGGSASQSRSGFSERRKNLSCHCRELHHDSSVVRPLVFSVKHVDLMCFGVARISIAGLLNKAFATDVRPIVYVRTSQTSLKMVSICASGVETAVKTGLEIRAADSRFGLPSSGGPANGKLRKRCRQHCTQDGRWPCHRHSRSLPNCV